ncbi:hypothetical protein D3C87_2051130 [compost metagenome]
MVNIGFVRFACPDDHVSENVPVYITCTSDAAPEATIGNRTGQNIIRCLRNPCGLAQMHRRTAGTGIEIGRTDYNVTICIRI